MGCNWLDEEAAREAGCAAQLCPPCRSSLSQPNHIPFQPIRRIPLAGGGGRDGGWDGGRRQDERQRQRPVTLCFSCRAPSACQVRGVAMVGGWRRCGAPAGVVLRLQLAARMDGGRPGCSAQQRQQQLLCGPVWPERLGLPFRTLRASLSPLPPAPCSQQCILLEPRHATLSAAARQQPRAGGACCRRRAAPQPPRQRLHGQRAAALWQRQHAFQQARQGGSGWAGPGPAGWAQGS